MMSPPTLDPHLTLGELVAEQPARAELFDGLGLDYCCGGRQTLIEACAAHPLELDSVLAALGALDPAGEAEGECARTDWRVAPLAELCLHITCAHHDRLRDELPRIDALLEKVTRVHGPRDPRLHEVRAMFGQIRAELEPHLESEERRLCNDYDPAGALCNTHGALLAALADLERDMHRHVHEENNILLPRARDV